MFAPTPRVPAADFSLRWALRSARASAAPSARSPACSSDRARFSRRHFERSASYALRTTLRSEKSLLHFPLSSVLLALAPVLLQFGLFLRWLHRRMRDDEITRAFVRDVALNHLPHIYSALRAIAAEQGITLEEPPLVQFLDLNGQRRRAD